MLTNFPNGLSSFGIPLYGESIVTPGGKAIFVSSVVGKNSNDGLSPDTAVATFAQGMTLATASKGDVIYILPGHAETVTTTNMTANKIGVTIVCLGNGSKRPTFTFGAAAATITVSAADITWKDGLFVANFDNVASAFTLTTAKNFRLEGTESVDSSDALHFMSIVTTNATNNAQDGLTVVGNMWYGLALAPLAFISILANNNHILIADNHINMAATNDVGHFVTIAAKVVLNFRCLRNILRVTGATNAAVGIFLTGSSTTNDGVVANNYVDSLDVTAPLLATAGTKLSFFENYYPVAADKNGALLPAIV